MRNWKFAISSADEAPDSAPILLKGDICEILKEAARLGYDAVEIHVRETDDIDYEVIKKCRDEYNIKISAIVTGRLNTHGKCNLMDDIPYIAHAAVEGIKTYIGIASNLDADIVLGWVRGNVPPGGRKSKYMSRLAKKLKILAEFAAQRNVKIFVEVINRYETNVFNTAKEIVVFLENYNIPNCYVHLDTFHMNIDEVDSAEAIITCGEKLGYM
ncbi:MAG TPA: sugar phosphate isomerase/epimerase, partial [Ruminiclostridium sp.]|nr:sugar phosphate isomerase/epimerase [Ruminiclostridium sp.]